MKMHAKGPSLHFGWLGDEHSVLVYDKTEGRHQLYMVLPSLRSTIDQQENGTPCKPSRLGFLST
jgi:hypothetical protein